MLMVKSMQETSKMINLMDRVHTPGLMVKNMWENGKKVNEMGRVH